MQDDMKKKAYEKTISTYVTRVCESLHRDCGEKPHTMKVDDKSTLADTY